MKTKNIYSLLISSIAFLSVFPSPAFPADNSDTSPFYRGNIYYEQGNYDEAIEQYDSILDSGVETGNLYYNLGNCYFKKGEPGKALLNYEKARRLIPMDKDLESNYEYARSLIKGGAVASQKNWFKKVSYNIFEKFTIDGLTISLSVCYILILFGILAAVILAPFRKNALISILFLGLFFIMGIAGLAEKVVLLDKEAIVAVEHTDARFEPMDKATTHFTLYEGMKVEVISSQDNWHKVKRQDNKSGWVENNAIVIF